MTKTVYIVGSKGIPAKYGGFETFVEKLTEFQQDKDIQYYVACMRENSAKSGITADTFEHNGAKCYNIDVPNIGPARAIAYDIAALNKAIEIAKENNAVAAINGGAFTDKSSTAQWTGNGGTPAGIVISEGKLVYKDVPDDEKIELVGITKEGKMIAGMYSFNNLKELNVKEAVSFGPVLVKEGEPTPMKGDGGWGVAPRTAMGQRADGSIVMLVIDGRSLTSGGATLKELQEVLLNTCNVVTAINLDGGKSTTMYLNGKVINNPASNVGERSIPSAIIVK